MFSFFDGDFRRKPQQSLRGASQTIDRQDLLQKVSEARKQRQDVRDRLSSAIKIQAFIRGTLSRIKEKRQQRLEFDKMEAVFPKNATTSEIVTVLGVLLQKLSFFYQEINDLKRLSWLSQLFLKHSRLCSEDLIAERPGSLHRIQKLLLLNIRCLVMPGNQVPIALPLRLLEVYTDPRTYSTIEAYDTKANHLLSILWLYLVKNEYFKNLRLVLECRVPKTFEVSPKAPTPLAQSLFDLFLRPLALTAPQGIVYRNSVFGAFLRDLFEGPLSAQISCFLIPALSQWPQLLSITDLLQTFQVALAAKTHRPQQNYLISSTPWLLYSFLQLSRSQTSNIERGLVSKYLWVLRQLVPTLLGLQCRQTAVKAADSDDDEENHSAPAMETAEEELLCDCLCLLNDPQHVTLVVQWVSVEFKEDALISLCHVCHTLLQLQKIHSAVMKFRLLYTLAFNPLFLHGLWRSIVETSTPSVFGTSMPLLQVVSKGLELSVEDKDRLMPQLTVFCALFGHLLPTLHDNEFFEEDPGGGSVVPFMINELISMSFSLRDVCLGLIELAYPDTRLSVKEDYKVAMLNVAGPRSHQTGFLRAGSGGDENHEGKDWLYLFRVAVSLLHQLYIRDTRRQFCPEDHWIAKQVNIPVDRPVDLRFGSGRLTRYRPFAGLRVFTREQLEEEGPPISTTEVRYMKILQEMPFVIPFHTRVKIFQALISRDKSESQGEMANFMMGPQIQALIRRNYIYEDAFDKLSPENEPNLKLRMRIQLVNAIGLDEAGIDGGGIFREFLSELLKTAFDPNRGFFKSTHDRQLYPNPGVAHIEENFPRHYYFIGRLLGKAIYENMLVELPFAVFFLAKLLGKFSVDVDIHHLASLDPIMHRNLIYLKTYDGDVTDLGLDFTVMNSELGENQVIELKPDGASTQVTTSNRIEYIHHMADYKLNKQIRAQCAAFKQGLANVINLEWIRMFDPRELQVLISGAHTPVDVEDLKRNTHYTGGYTDQHPVILCFWKVVQGFSEEQKRKLLKFVTSCSRPPLLGFKELSPSFCIQNAGSEPDRLPTASTCMNLLKLPAFKDKSTMEMKLRYAIESGAGFELS